MNAIGAGSVSTPDYDYGGGEVDSVDSTEDVGGEVEGGEIATSTEDSSEISGDGVGEGDQEDSPLLGGLSDNFSSIQDSSSDAHAEGSLQDGTFDVGAEAQASSHEESTTQNGDTQTTRTEDKEAHARVAASGDLSQGRLSTDVDLGASVNASQSGLTRKEAELGGVKLRGEVGGSAGASGEAELRSRNEVNLSQGTIDSDSRAAIGVRGSASGHVASEVEALGITRRDQASVSANVDAHAEVSNRLKIDESGIESSSKAEANAHVAADAALSTRYSSDAGSVESTVRGEARLGAEAHANRHFKLTEDTFEMGGHAGASANASLMAEGKLQAETANGSRLDATGGMTVGSIGFGAGGDIGRRPGETSLGVEAFGSIVGGAHFDIKTTVKDRDIAEATTAPMRALSGAYGVIGDGAELAGDFTESARQSANQRQEFLQEMGSVPTGNLIADTGIAAAETLHGGYTRAVEMTDNVADGLTDAYQNASQTVSQTAARVTDRVEQTVGGALDYGVKTAHSGYQYGRAIGGGFVQGLGQGARNIGSFLNPFD